MFVPAEIVDVIVVVLELKIEAVGLVVVVQQAVEAVLRRVQAQTDVLELVVLVVLPECLAFSCPY